MEKLMIFKMKFYYLWGKECPIDFINTVLLSFQFESSRFTERSISTSDEKSIIWVDDNAIKVQYFKKK